MKTEEFFKKTLEQIFGFDKSELNKHFKEFKREFKNLPSVLGSLEEPVCDNDGRKINSSDINESIESLKAEFPSNLRKLSYIFRKYLLSRITLFHAEIKIQIEFAKQEYATYKKIKEKVNIDSKKIFLHIHHFSVHVANICKLYDKLINLPPLEKLYNSNVNLVSAKALRNHLEHYEERLEAWNYLHIGKPLLDMNVINNCTKGIILDNCLRVINVDEDIFYILGEKYSLNELYDIINSIETIILGLEKRLTNQLS